MKKLILFLSTFVLLSCASQVSNTNNDGSSYEKAIVIKASNEMIGVGKEYEWIKINFPGAQLVEQSSGPHNGRKYDIITIKTSDGQKRTFYFDINNFYGKY